MSHNEAEEVGVEESKVNFDPTWSFVPPQNEPLAPQEPPVPSDDAADTDAAQQHEADTESGSDADGVEEHVTDMETEIETIAPDTEEGDLDVKIRKLPEPPVELSYGVKHFGRPKLVCERPGCENCVPKLDGGTGCPDCEVRKREEVKKRREEYRRKQAEMQQEQQRVVAGEAGKRNVRKHREALGTEPQKRPVPLHAQVKKEPEARESEVNEVLIKRNRDFDEGDMMLMSAHLPADLDPIMQARLRSVLTSPSGYSTEEYRRVLRDFACRYLSSN